MARIKKYVCASCKAEVLIKDIVNISAAKEYGMDYFNLCTKCYDKILNGKKRGKA